MTFDEFMARIAMHPAPEPDLSHTLTALWWDCKGDWEYAHAIATVIPMGQGSAVHVYLHREEGVLWKADDGYRRVGRKQRAVSLADEWTALVQGMLSGD